MAAGDEGWMITGVSLRSAGVAEQLNPQDGLYLIAERSGEGTHYRLGGAIRDVLVAAEHAAPVIAAIADPATRIVSFTVTEKGYCRAGNGALDQARADAGSFYPLLAEGMRRRKASGASGLTLLSCDNLVGNGGVLDKLMREYLATHAPDLADWFVQACTSPSTMVDRIVPQAAVSPKGFELAQACLACLHLGISAGIATTASREGLFLHQPAYPGKVVSLRRDVAEDAIERVQSSATSGPVVLRCVAQGDVACLDIGASATHGAMIVYLRSGATGRSQPMTHDMMTLMTYSPPSCVSSGEPRIATAAGQMSLSTCAAMSSGCAI